MRLLGAHAHAQTPPTRVSTPPTRVSIPPTRVSIPPTRPNPPARALLRVQAARREELRVEGAALVLQRMYRVSNYWAAARAFVELKRRERRERIRNWCRRWRAVATLRR